MGVQLNAIHHPHVKHTVGLVEPKQVVLAVAVVIPRLDDPPVGIPDRQRTAMAGNLEPVHQPDINHTAFRILPYDIRFAVAVEISDSLDVPFPAFHGER